LQATRYANVSAKIGAERSYLLNNTKMRSLTETKDLNDFVSALNDTIYKDELSKIRPPFSSRKLERVFQESLIQDYIKIIKNSPKTSTPFLRMFLQRLEIENIKILVKGIQAELPFEEKKLRIYFQVEDFLKRRDLFEEASKASDVKMLSETLKKTEYSLAIKEGLLSYEENGTTACLDILLDKIFYERLHDSFSHLPKSERRYASFYAQNEEASYLFLTLLRGKNLGYDVAWLRTVLPKENLDISPRILDALIEADSFESALNLVLKTPYGNLFTNGKNHEEIIAAGERAFRNSVFTNALKKRVAEVFNIGLPLAFMIQKETEIHNLNIISLGIETELSPEKIQSKLILSS
jgi:V/A-type H+/Na+-transporting ATPase subunit C